MNVKAVTKFKDKKRLWFFYGPCSEDWGVETEIVFENTKAFLDECLTLGPLASI